MTVMTLNLNNTHKYFNVTCSIRLLLAISAMLLLAACGTKVNVNNSYVQEEADDAHIARVYFIRPLPLKYKGIADAPLVVELNNEFLLKINEGWYTMAKVKPTKATITTRSKTMFINKDQPIDISRSREYRFIAGKTYFILLERVNEEFRGIYYDPAPVSFEQALELTKHLRTAGLARKEPIRKIKDVAEAPKPSPLEPALPENLYPGKPYLIKGNPKYVAPEVPEGKNEITFDEPPPADQPTP